MKTHDMFESKFLKREDVGVGILVTIKGVGQANVAKDGADEQLKYVLLFQELDKPLVLNVTNITTLEQICGDDTDKWTGRQVVLFDDPSVMYKGEKKGGIRIRAKKGEQPADNLPF